jgi:hypothetical protein
MVQSFGLQLPTTASAQAPTPTAQPTQIKHSSRTLAETQPLPTPTATPEPPLPGSGPEMAGQLVITTRHLDFYRGRWTFPAEEIVSLVDEIEVALEEAEGKLGTELADRTSLAFYQPAMRPIAGVRALAYSDQRRIELFYSPEEPSWRAIAIATHELGHQLEADRYGDGVQKRADTILHEGLATWLAGSRWLEMRGAASWRERGLQLLESGRLLSLLRDPSGPASNDAYDGWASFVDYLIHTYGWEAFDDLYRSSGGRTPGSADYDLVYGQSLDALAREWRAWLTE